MSESWENDLKKALILIRNLRYRGYIQDIDPGAMRVALKFCLLYDDYCAKELGLTEKQDEKLTEIAQDLFKRLPKTTILKAGGAFE